MNPIRQYIRGQVVELHFLRMEDSSTWLLLQKDGRSSGRCYHVTPAQAELLPRRLTLLLEVFAAPPHICYVSLPREGLLHHTHLAFTHRELARCDFALQLPPPTPEQPAENGLANPVQLLFNF